MIWQEWHGTYYNPTDEYHIKDECPKCGSARMPVGVPDHSIWGVRHYPADKCVIEHMTIHDRSEYMVITCRRCGFAYATKTAERGGM